jgi:heme-degrading monooxygenase HmoA
MIARIWRDETRAEDAAAYLEVLHATGVRDYLAVPGNRGVWVLMRRRGDAAEFNVLTLWDSLEAIRAFAGDDVNRARYYPEDSKYLLHMAPEVDHFDCAIARPG